MAKFSFQRKRRKSVDYAALGRKSAAVRRARRMAEMTADQIADALAAPMEGEAIGCLQWHDFRTGKIRRLTVLRGDRIDRVMLRSPDGRQTKAHGWTWIMDHLRGYLAGRKA